MSVILEKGEQYVNIRGKNIKTGHIQCNKKYLAKIEYKFYRLAKWLNISYPNVVVSKVTM